MNEEVMPYFILTISGMLFAALGLVVRYTYKSKCIRVKICCLTFERDTHDEVREDLEAIRHGMNPAPSAGTLQRGSLDGR
jgi:hypothetical protein